MCSSGHATHVLLVTAADRKSLVALATFLCEGGTRVIDDAEVTTEWNGFSHGLFFLHFLYLQDVLQIRTSMSSLMPAERSVKPIHATFSPAFATQHAVGVAREEAAMHGAAGALFRHPTLHQHVTPAARFLTRFRGPVRATR